jgi:NAD-dependent deacetylase
MRLGEFAERLKACDKVVFFTGAGISTNFGNPAFSSSGGVWTKYEPVYSDEFLHSEEARMRHWRMQKETRELYKSVTPNAGHYAIAEFERRNQLLGLITQSIDGLHSLAGVSNAKIAELHGTDRFLNVLIAKGNSKPNPSIIGI